MVKIRCNGCGRILDNPNWNQLDTCANCGNTFTPLIPRYPIKQNPYFFQTSKIQQPLSSPPVDKSYILYEKIRNYGFYILLGIILIYAVYRIILSFL